MLVQFDIAGWSGVSMQLLNGVRVLVQFQFVFSTTTMSVQFLNRVVVLVYRLFAWGVDVVMCVFV